MGLLDGKVALITGAGSGMAKASTELFVAEGPGPNPNARIVKDVSRAVARRPLARVVVCQDPTRVQRDLLFEARIAVEERCDLWALASGRAPLVLLAVDEEAKSLRRAHLRVGCFNPGAGAQFA